MMKIYCLHLIKMIRPDLLATILQISTETFIIWTLLYRKQKDRKTNTDRDVETRGPIIWATN